MLFGKQSLPDWQPVAVTLEDDFIVVDNADGFIYKFRTGTYGYNEIWRKNGPILIYNEQWSLEYLRGASNWRPRGLPQTVVYSQPQPYHAIVERSYDDFLGTTFTMKYDFRGGYRPKISFNGYIGQIDTYRAVWNVNGINTDYIQDDPLNRQVAIWNEGQKPISFSYDDIYREFGDITSTELTVKANDHKLEERFEVGLLPVGPLTLDPTFGETGVGGTAENIKNYILGSWFTCPEAGTADSITVYLDLAATARPVKCMIYKYSDSTLVGETEERSVNQPDGWFTFNFSAPKPTLTNQAYWLVGWGGTLNSYMMYDASDAGKGCSDAETYTPPDPAAPNPFSPSGSSKIYSIYCNYTAAGGGVSIPVAMHHYGHHISKIIRG